MTNITPYDSYIDGFELLSEVTELQDEIEELQNNIQEKQEDIGALDCVDDANEIEELESNVEELEIQVKDIEEDLSPRKEFLEDVQGSGLNIHDINLIADDEFVDYAERFAHDCGEIQTGSSIGSYVDWELYATHLKIDYVSAYFAGAEFWFRG